MTEDKKVSVPMTEFRPLRLDLQYFSEDPQAGAQGSEGGQGGEQQQQQQAGTEGQTKTFSQEEVNSIASKESKKAQSKVYKTLGIENPEEAKGLFDQFKQWQESQKTDAQKQSDQLSKYEQDLNQFKSENENLKAELSATKKGVSAESLSDVVTLAKTLVSEDVDLDGAIDKVLEKYPHFKGEAQQEGSGVPKPKLSQGTHKKESPSDLDKWLDAFK